MSKPRRRPNLRPGQEWVWDYPRPPRLELVSQTVRIEHDGRTLAETAGALRVLETSHPPTIYLPPDEVYQDRLRFSTHRSFCEWKGQASYVDLIGADDAGSVVPQVGWFYPEPTPAFADIRGYLSFYPSKLDACFVGDERVLAQEGDFYGGWITENLVGPFKGAPGTLGW